MKKLLICTHNPGKLIEIKDLLKDLNMEIMSLGNLKINFDVEENAPTYRENAILKAKTYGEKSNLISLADDTGLEVKALDNKPGVHSKRFFKTSGETRNRELLSLIKDKTDKSAQFVAAVAVYNPITKQSQFFSGELDGTLIEPQGKAHKDLGYDSIFLITTLGKTFGEASLTEKNQVSHRAIAINKAKEYIKTLL